ncbi:hypothetical protein [Massilia soli]|nr:hypothetical protein [Massilia soli]
MHYKTKLLSEPKLSKEVSMKFGFAPTVTHRPLALGAQKGNARANVARHVVKPTAPTYG